ncbi:MAG: hypothetical protein M1812_006141 [Candelaria pacifica]|nr:MAG: hypothetical protein M1812_006141 [Candelaria pacifica]
MRRIIRFERSLDQLLDLAVSSRSSPSVCLTCRRRTLSTSPRATFSTSRTQRDSEDNKPSYTERLRRKIWGTDNPPGQKDPYQKLSPEELEAEEEPADELAPAEDESRARVPYKAASTWDGLESVGGSEWLADEWARKHPFRGFLHNTKMTDRYELIAALHRAVTEVLLLHDEERPYSYATEAAFDDLPTSQTAKVQIRKGLDLNNQGYQNFILDFPKGEGLSETMLQSMLPEELLDREVNVEMKAPTEDAENYNIERAAPTDTSSEERPEINMGNPEWLKVSLEGQDGMKFAVVKRVMQLTGAHIPDVKIQGVTTVQSLLNALIKPPKPRKLVDALIANNRLAGLPNVKVFDRRVTPIDREKTVGRWKVIERELERRELPVTGRP